MDSVKDVLDNIINYSLFFYNDEIVEEHLQKYIIYLNKKIKNDYCDLYFENYFSIQDVDDIITLEEYINRLVESCNISNSMMIGAIIYLERLNICVNKYNIHKLLLISLLLSSKFLEDIIFNNKYWARCGGVCLKTINRLEKIFLIKIKNNLYIHTNEFYNKFVEILQ
jgi:hypothetical protein